MDNLLDAMKQLVPSERTKFYLLIAYVFVLIALTVTWASAVFIEITRKRASKLSVKYGGVDDKSKNTGKLIGFGALVVVTWVVFFIIV